MSDLQGNKFISKNNSGFPAYLDWDKLRAEGISYLGKLSGNIWTDYNTHDPGITILEVLCYALMDLGYRTNLPVADIFAKNPDPNSKENNFFTPSQILTCNPLTITDFRKMLIDIEGVKNAWLEDSFYDCYSKTNNVTGGQETGCLDFCYNGLYHVYVELDKEYVLKDKIETDEYNNLIGKIKQTLMAHRNLCEDFIDIHVLCKKQIGLCADIELEIGADANDVYKNIIENLRDFFSPSPKFYTLSQLLDDKGKHIEDVFAGRPYNITESHGFVDTEEFEQIPLRKEIHLSDIYHIIFDVTGVRSVKNLAWKKNCTDKKAAPDKGWIWKIPENHIPDFSVDCSVFTFNRQGIPVAVDTRKFNALFNIDFTHNGKVLYTMPSPYLDVEMPKAVYRSDLGDYLSIQNEFPRVYGIEKGGLPADAPDRRKAQAWQLKAYLLFFDQLLANYVSQLKNIRSLFAFSSPENSNDATTYFINQLTDVADFQKLVRFKVNGESPSIAGDKGITLAIPFERKTLEDLIKDGNIKKINCEKDIPPYTFCDQYNCDVAITNLLQDLFHGDYAPSICSNENNTWFFYFITSSSDFALISQNFYKSEEDAREAADTVKYAGTYTDNFYSFINNDNRHTFYLDLKLAGYADYLKRITEDESLYMQRREDFLNHLLSRFAEKFTDFAMLSFGFLEANELVKKEISDKENFLANYDELSSNRGKGYDYMLDGWNNTNISGFEKRVAALAGISGVKKNFLCNFVVEEYEKQYVFEIKFSDGTIFFTSDDKFFSEDSAEQSARALFEALLSKENYEVVDDKDISSFHIKIQYPDNRNIFYGKRFDKKEDARFATEALTGLFSVTPTEKDVYESKKVYKIILRDYLDNEFAASKKNFTDIEKAKSFAAQSSDIITKPNNWEKKGEKKSFGKIYFNDANPEQLSFIDVEAFKIDIDNNIVGKPDKFKYELLDKSNNFKFISAGEFDSQQEAEEECLKQIVLLTNPDNYFIYLNSKLQRYQLQLRNRNKVIAICDSDFDSETDASGAKDTIINIVKKHQYFVNVEEKTIRWNFGIYLGYEPDNYFLFKSVSDYKSPEIALQSAKEFYASIDKIEISIQKNIPALSCTINNENVICVYKEQPGDLGINEKIPGLLALKKEINAVINDPSSQSYSRFVRNEEPNPDLKFVYRLADRNNYHAFYTGKDLTNTHEVPAPINEVVEKKNELFQNRIEYNYPDISLGGDIAVERKDGFHFEVKIHSPYNELPAGTVLFESVKWYPSQQEAASAFDSMYLDILAKAISKENYGKDQYISVDEISPADYNKTKSVVFIPKKTKKLFQSPQDELITIAKQYPVRYITKDEDEFCQRFCYDQVCDNFYCGQDGKVKKQETDCDASAPAAIKYFFYVLSDKDGNEQWQSVQYFLTPEETIHQFYFFFSLLAYPGNFVVDKSYCNCNCLWKIFIREILAESKRKYTSEAEAWGMQGVEKFICASQSKNSFHTYIDKKNGCYTFNIDCDNNGLTHPCEYDTAQQRDKAVNDLWQAFKTQEDWKIPVIKYEEEKCLLHDQKGLKLAIIGQPDPPTGAASDHCICLADLADLVDINGLEGDKEKNEILIPGTDYTFQPYEKEIEFENWRKDLLKTFCFYPVKKTGEKSYILEIKLPEPGCCGDDLADSQPCESEGTADKHTCTCCIAWQSGCCFDTCEKALVFYKKIKKCLQDPDNYKPVFDCECGPYGIRLYCNCNEDAVEQDSPDVCCSEIIAFNPQCYTTPKMDCDAVQRAKKLINSEGLHLVEHILLRPRCEADCECITAPVPCPDTGKKVNCNDWIWKESGDKDPCNEKINAIEFKAGADPYSFIATLALPAWPERFRTNQNRLIIENLLYKEAPAHILLRILWLAPRDLYQFEDYFKNWGLWNSENYHKCPDKNPSCDFIGFLLHTDFECPGDCNECMPCETTVPEIPSCFDRVKNENPCTGTTVLDNINELYCWETLGCLPDIVIPGAIKATGDLEPKEKFKIFNQRTNTYSKNVSQVFPEGVESKIKGQVLGFLKDPNPSNQKYSDLIGLILKEGQGTTQVPSEQQVVLISNVTHQYMDRVFANDGDVERIYELKAFFKKLKKENNIDMSSVLKNWD